MYTSIYILYITDRISLVLRLESHCELEGQNFSHNRHARILTSSLAFDAIVLE
jgi:hypothetical protein